MRRVVAYSWKRHCLMAVMWSCVWLCGGGMTAAEAHSLAEPADSAALTARERRRIEKAEGKAQRLAQKRRMKQDLTIDQRKQLNERVK